MSAANVAPAIHDPVSNVLKWVLLAVAVASFALLGWATAVTYALAPPQPDRFATSRGVTLMSANDIFAGKGGFQKADLMDYGSIYGMGSYYGEDYTASVLNRLGTLTQEALAKKQGAHSFASLPAMQQAAVKSEMQRELQTIDLTRRIVVVPDALASAISAEQIELSTALHTANPLAGWTPAYSLSAKDALHTADFLVFSALTTVARRPGTTGSWTENWPFEPLVGNAPTTNTFRWTWISFCFTFLMFGVVLFIYEYWLNDPDVAPMDPVLAKFGSLTPSQRRVGKYFLIVAAVLLVQILAGTIMAHSYYDRTSFYGIDINRWFPFNFLRDVHIQT
ncbi:MAG TPA: hypothetical protein VMD08_15600, partial [Candidatus Baltobacteraceae bacterium]|nr:hypothetical protein [Candidatus Baltobacteraceae bacterium]